MAENKSLRSAEKAKVDEFYTQLSDIEKEMRYYESILKIKWCFVIAMIHLKAIFSNILY